MVALNDSIGNRLTERRKELGLSREAVAKRMSISVSTVQAHENGRNALKPENLLAYARILKVTPNWILTGVDDDLMLSTDLIPASDMAACGDTSETFIDDDIVPIPMYDIAASAGPGAYVDEKQPKGYYPVALNFLQSMTRTTSDHIVMFSVSGDSMEPDFHNGDLIFVDTSINRYAGERIYVFNYQDQLYIKKISPEFATGRIKLQSSNASYETQHVDSHESLNFVGIPFARLQFL